MERIKCMCGCGEEINKYDQRKREKKYVKGHTNKGKSNFWKIKDKVKKRTLHERANKICPKDKCFASNEQCSKKLEIAHIDGNPENNKVENLVCLCGSHHRLYDFGKIPLEKLKEIRPYKIISGKRRYKK